MIEGDRVSLRLTQPDDADDLQVMLRHPDVARWWGRWNLDRVRSELIDRTDDVVVFAVECDGRLIGAIQYEEETDEDYRHAGMDLFLDPACHGQALGRETVALLCRYLFGTLGHHRLVIDPAAENEVAIACYAAVGFQPIGTMRQYERTSDGNWRDGLLMDLLSADLVD